MAAYVGQLLAYIAATLKLAVQHGLQQHKMDDRLFADDGVSRITLKWRCGRFEEFYQQLPFGLIRRNKQLPLWRRTDDCEVETETSVMKGLMGGTCVTDLPSFLFWQRKETLPATLRGDKCSGVAPDGRVRARRLWSQSATWMQFVPECTALWTSAESQSPPPPCVYRQEKLHHKANKNNIRKQITEIMCMRRRPLIHR